MKRSGPLYTLLAGLLLGLFMLSLNATTGEPGPSSYRPPASPTASPPPSPPPAQTPSPTPTPRPTAQKEYAGRTADDVASVAISLRGDKAIAYYCDGRTQEACMRGPVAADGFMVLTGKGGAKLEGALKAEKVTGTVEIQGSTRSFTAAKAVKPSGLYRATAEVRGAEIDAGWIITQDGRQVGIVKRNGEPSSAPPIDPATGAVTVDGAELTARPVVP